MNSAPEGQLSFDGLHNNLYPDERRRLIEAVELDQQEFEKRKETLGEELGIRAVNGARTSASESEHAAS